MMKDERIFIIEQCGHIEDALEGVKQAHELASEPNAKEILFGVSATLEGVLARLVKGV